MQVIDLLILDIHSFRFDKRHLVAAAFYIEIGITFKAFSREEISKSSAD